MPCLASHEADLFSSLPISLYLVDTFIYAASATAAASVSCFFFVTSSNLINQLDPAFPFIAWLCISVIRTTNVQFLRYRFWKHCTSFFPLSSFTKKVCFKKTLFLLSCWHVWRLYWVSHSQSGYTSMERLFVQEVT